jgi:hypothetical protein
MTKKPAPKKAPKRQPKPRTTVVPDRSPWQLGFEAKMLADFLRGVGADGTRAVPPGSSDKERKEWLESRSRFAKRVPEWMLDYVVAILEQIPERPPDRPSGQQPDPAMQVLDGWKRIGHSTADSARLAAGAEAGQKERETGQEVADDVVEERAKTLMRKAYRRPTRA